MKKDLFQELMTSAREALEHARGKRALRTTELPAAPTSMTAAEIRAVRAQVNASQAVFARYLNVSTKLVQAWEAGRRTPGGAALKLLRLGGENPDLVFGPSGHPAMKSRELRDERPLGRQTAGIKKKTRVNGRRLLS
ncbi:MAG TPA: helix-turn-helix domain-containing protein [Gemmatimonadales bacterium]|jgi:putative transcriptional regulator|nr:helix-turn-helix domain-containing protein [Gemmatimonadales bacterium]